MMAGGLSSNCTTHPGFEAIGRCKQCGKPFCSKCQIKGPTGIFCCPECKETHEAFTTRAQQFDSMRRDSTTFEKIKITIRKVVMTALFILIIAVIFHFVGVDIPVVSDTIRSITDK